MSVNGTSKQDFDTIEDAVEAIHDGEFIVVLDSADRENEGDLIMAADKVSNHHLPMKPCIHQSPCTLRFRPRELKHLLFVLKCPCWSFAVVCVAQL